jgi:predicted transcriptional regulator
MLYIAERTVTYRKDEDSTSLSQMTSGIRADERLIRGDMGISLSQAKRESKRLLELGVLRKELRSRDGAKLPTLYAIDWYELVRYAKQTLGELDQRWDSLPVQVEPGVGPLRAKGVGPSRAIQKQIYTETEKQKQRGEENWIKSFESRFLNTAQGMRV